MRKLTKENNAVMRATSTLLINMEKEVDKRKTEKRTLFKVNAELLSFAIRQWAKSSYTGNSITDTIHPIYLRFAFHIEQSIVPYRCNEVSKLVSSTSKQRKRWRRRNEVVRKLGVLKNDRTQFAPSNPFIMCSSNSQYTLSTSSAEQRLHGTEVHEACEEKWQRLFPTRNLVANIVCILHVN